MTSRITRSKNQSRDDEPTTQTQQMINICPICERGFKTSAGLSQHVSKSHSAKEIEDAINNRTRSSLQAGAHTTQSNVNPITDGTRNKLQIIQNDLRASTGRSYHLFDIIENESSGDCLFSAVLEFLKNEIGDQTVPINAYDLRLRAVAHILNQSDNATESNFERFHIHLVENLRQKIPSLMKEDTPVETLRTDYANYMSTPHTYGTIAELCSTAEIFNFAFYVVRRIDHKSFTCYDYGSLDRSMTDQSFPTIHLLFSGDIGEGHFRWMSPIALPVNSSIPIGALKLIEGCSSSMTVSIAPTNFDSFSPKPEESSDNADNNAIPEIEFDDFIILLAKCKSNIRVLKRVPRAARILAANRLSQCIEACLANPKWPTNWKNLLSFAYTSLRVPERVNNTSLATLVKRNINKPEFVFTERVKKKPITLSKRVECKVSDGDIKGAVRILSSSDTLAAQNESTFKHLQAKHPPPSRELNLPEPPDQTMEPLVVTEKEVFHAIKSCHRRVKLACDY